MLVVTQEWLMCQAKKILNMEILDIVQNVEVDRLRCTPRYPNTLIVDPGSYNLSYGSMLI